MGRRLYIQLLGQLVNRQVIGEGGGVHRIHPYQRLSYRDYTEFDNILESSGAAMWYMVFGVGFLYALEPLYATRAFVLHLYANREV